MAHHLTKSEIIRLLDWLRLPETLAQPTKLSDLAERAAAALQFSVTVPQVADMLESAGLKFIPLRPPRPRTVAPTIDVAADNALLAICIIDLYRRIGGAGVRAEWHDELTRIAYAGGRLPDGG